MGISPNKVQMNVYVPEDIDKYVSSWDGVLNISKSDFIYLIAAYSRKFFATEDIRKLAGDMLVFGEEGLRKVEANGHDS